MDLNIPSGVLADSYKASHYLQYPAAQRMVAYGEFRTGFNRDTQDTRLIFCGIEYLLRHYVCKQWTKESVQRTARFFKTHQAPLNTEYPFPEHLFMKFVEENNGYFPVKIESLREGTCVHARVPVYQITAEGVYAPLCTYLETILTMLWYPSTVATLSRRAKDVIAKAFDESVDGGRASPLLSSRLHDFGFRGCTCPEQAVIGGCAHLLNFEGSDTMSALYYAQFELNDGEPVGSSIPATEHSVMTSWPGGEREALQNMLKTFGGGIFACVMDSYNYTRALNAELPAALSAQPLGASGFMVLRPDSGDPVEVVLEGLHAAERVFGADVNACGYKVLRGAGVIQGDGIDVDTLARISDAVSADGYSAQCVAYGMGGGLLQKVNRDTMSFATKLCHIVLSDGQQHDIMKRPATGTGKISFPGVLAVKRVDGIPTVFPADSAEVSAEENILQVVYDHGPVDYKRERFSEMRQRVAEEWQALPPVPPGGNISVTLRRKIEEWQPVA